MAPPNILTRWAYEQAQWLLLEHLQPLVKADLHNSMLFLVERDGTSSGHFLPQESWINANVGGATELEIQQLRTCMEVIGQLSKSDYFRWREFYHSFWRPELMNHLGCSECSTSLDGIPDPTQYDDLEELTRSNGPRFILDCMDVKDGSDTFKMLSDFLFMDIKEALGKRHRAVLAELTSRGPCPTSLPYLINRTAQELNSTKDETPCIELGLTFSSAGLTITANFRALAALLDKLAEHTQRKKNAARYKVTTLWIPAAKSLAPVEIDILIDIIASETSTVRHLHIANAMMMLSVTKRLQVFQQLLRTTVCSLPDSEPTLKTLHLEDVPMVHPPVASICSALWYPNSLRDFHLQCVTPETVRATAKDGNTKLMWAWIAFGIFHPDSEANLDRLNISGLPLSYESLTTFASILRTPHPGRQLWVLEYGDLPQGAGCEEILMPAGRRVLVQLAADTKLRVSPKARAKALEPVALEADEFEVALTLAAWICVVVPGCGLGWVPSSSIVSRREIPSKCSTSEGLPAGVHQTRLGKWPLAGAHVKVFNRNPVGEIDQLDNIKFLLRMIGHGLQKLSFSSYALVITGADLAETLDCCPKLMHLNLMGNKLTSLAPLIDQFRLRQCQIAYLNIHTVETQAQIFSQLTELLESPFSKPLRYVAVNGMVDSAERFSRLAAALKSSKSLQLLYFYSANPEQRMLMMYTREVFQSTPGDPQLLMSTKIAFLSAIQAHSMKSLGTVGSTTNSLGKLDSCIASLIFAFAAVQIPRTFY